MKILTEPGSIRAAIADLLSDAADERIIAVAYVGADALSFLSAPSGLTVYCWPQAGGTNPYAIEELVRAGANVHFVKRLHAKVYWSRARGAMIGSANLTANALGEQALTEVAVLIPAVQFNMDGFVKSFAVESDFASTLGKLHEAHVRFLQRNPSRQKPQVNRSVLPLYSQWLAGAGRAEWRLGYCQYGNPPKDAVEGLEQRTGSREFTTFCSTARRDDLKAGVFQLLFAASEVNGTVKVSNPSWWTPATVVRSNNKRWKTYPYCWFTRVDIPKGTRPPFKVSEARFRRAFAITISESGGLEWLNEASLRPTKTFLERLGNNYEAIGN